MSSQSSPSFAGLCLTTGLFVWAAYKLGPVMIYNEIQPLAALAYALAVMASMKLLVTVLGFLAQFVDWNNVYKPSGLKGTATWATLKDLGVELTYSMTGPFWGVSVDRCATALFINYASVAMTIASTGAGKGIYTVITNIFSIKDSKLIVDFKGEISCITKDALESRGEIVRILNPGGLWKDIIGEGESYNPLDIIADDLYRPGGLRDVPDDLRELSAQIKPEPAQAKDDDSHWREGGRQLVADVSLLEVMIEGYDATLSSVALLIEDRKALEHNLRWVVGIDLEGKPLPEGPMPIEQTEWAQNHDPEDLAEFVKLVRARAAKWLALMCNPDSRTYDSFCNVAQMALAPFAFGRLAPSMRRSTFSMNDLKEGDRSTNLFIVADASRMESYKAYIGLIQFCVMTAIKRHPNKSRPVFCILDEATNYTINALESLLTWGRSYGLRLHLIFQDLSAFERVYGKTALETLLSEAEIKQFLPGQRSPKTLEMISKMLGDQSVMAASLSRHQNGIKEQLNETGRPLMMADEIRRCDYGLLLVRRAPPVLIEPISYASVDPWRTQAGGNPFHGNKPFLQKVRLRLKQ